MPAPLAVLWDADGVLQHLPPGWYDDIVGRLGRAVVEDLNAAELPCLVGGRFFPDAIQEVLSRHQVEVPLEEVLGYWDRFTVDDDALRVVDDVRASGLTCVLATNQQEHRAALMKQRTPYAQHMDRTYYSCELGVAKPDPEYFRRVVGGLGIDCAAAVFVDDNPANVEAARSLGIASALHDPASGAGVLREELADLGVPIAPARHN